MYPRFLAETPKQRGRLQESPQRQERHLWSARQEEISLSTAGGTVHPELKCASRRSYCHPPLRFSTGRILMNASTAWILPS